MANLGSGIWSPFKEILAVVEIAVIHKRSEIYAELDETITKHKPIFLGLLKNLSKNASHREQIKKAHKYGLTLEGQKGTIKLQESLIQEILLISDALELNEFSVLELMLEAEHQLPNFPGFSQQLVAALLYHDGRRCLLSALKLLLTARPGITWSTELDDRIVELIEKLVNQLLDDGLVSKILLLLEEISLPKELKKLEDARCLLDGKHKKLITELIEEQQQLLADCLFVLSCQYPLQKDECIKLLDYLKLVAPNTSDGSLDFVTLRVFLAVIASFNCNIIDSAVENIEDSQYQQLPYFKDKKFLINVHQVIVRPDVQLWQMPGLKFVIQWCWSVFLRSCSAHPELVDYYSDVIEEDESSLDSAIDGDALKFLRTCVIQSKKFHEEEYFLKIVHSFITSFIVKFPLKMKELRTRGDENAHILQAHLNEGMEPPQGLRHDFQEFMSLVSSLYDKDPLGLELNSEYWIPPEPLGGIFSPQPLRKNQQNTDQRKLMLNKFVRLAGDILLQPLYVPYISMLTSLSNNEQSASYCFRLLSNGSTERGGACSVSWDHFFASLKQYYLSLRQVTDASDHRSHVHTHYEISPEEQAGLESVLRLIKVVTENSENVRVALCENQNWLPVASLLGLVCCPVPPSLKGLLLETLAAFSKTPEIAASLWQSLEASQVLQTTTPSGSNVKSGIAVELQEIESRNEVYPETRGFLKLLDQLTEVAIPTTLGAGHRVPGFHPYLNFLIDNVFLTFKTRAYQDPSEKWKIASEVLSIFVKLLKAYEPQPEDFMEKQVEIQGVNFGKAAKPAGFQLLSLLLNDTPMLRMILAIVDDVLEHLQTIITTHEFKDILESAACKCLDLLVCVFEKQGIFMEHARSVGSSIILSLLDELLLSVNPKTGRPDYLFILGRYMTINNVKPSLTLNVVRMFKYVCEDSKVQKEVIEILTQDEVSSREFLVGFSEQLENIEPEDEETNREAYEKLEDNDSPQEKCVDLIRQNIVGLLITSLQHSTPNMAQFMLGFEVKRPISKTNLQDPGVGGFPKTCLHSVIDILNRGLTDMSSSMGGTLTPKLSELLYRLIYMLCSNTDTGPAVRRYLHTHCGFFTTHCKALPFVSTTTEENTDELQYIRLINQQTWLLKAIAIELRVVAASRMRSGLQQLLTILYSDETSRTAPVHQFNTENVTGVESSFSRQTLSQTMFQSCFSLGADSHNLILSLLKSMSFTQRYPPNVELNFFDYSAIEQLIISCEETDEMGVVLCNVKKLFRILMNEMSNSQLAVTAVQKQQIFQEVKSVLRHAVDRNVVRESFHSKQSSFDAWRQVVEVTFAVCPEDVIQVDKKQFILTELLHALIPMINDEDNLPELTSAMGGTILSLMANLWFTVTQMDSVSSATDNVGISLSSLASIFSGIIEAIVASGGGQPRVRANLYGAFLYYIQIGQTYASITTEGISDSIFGLQSKENWETNALEILNKYGEAFLDVVAKDTCQGPCISRMMGMSVLDAIASLDWKHKYLMMMSSHGHLRVLIDQLLDDDIELTSVLSVQPQSMKPLYLFESKMAFLAKVASTDYGAQILLQVGLISRLTECQFLDFHVSKPAMLSNATLHYSQVYDPFLPSLPERYSKIFSAFAKLILSFLSSVGVQHQIAIAQIQTLIMSHKDVIQDILQDNMAVHSINSLKQLSLTIAIISVLPITDRKDDALEILTDDQRQWRTFMNRIQRLMLALLNKYSSSTIEKQTEEILGDNAHDVTTKSSPLNVTALETRNTLLQIRTRILTFCKNIISSQGLSGPYFRALFGPTFSDAGEHETRLITGKPVSTKQLSSLSVLVRELKDYPETLKKSSQHLKVLQRKIDSISDMSHDELKEILSQEEDTERLPYQQRHIVVKRILRKLQDLREAEASFISYIVEHVIYMLWRHIDYYYIHCIPTEESFLEPDLSRTGYTSRARRLTDGSFTSFMGNVSNTSKYERTLHGRTLESETTLHGSKLKSGTSQEDIKELKIEAATILTDSLWKKILESDQSHGKGRSRLSFSAALVRRLQGLIKLNS
ncbi:nuclear pore complex protein Nup205-like isoform X1 [Hydractinia symbiolongicarpus]|uniref:nuclear pore complex protein Nup205-like isoform X1 n=1 Tax=Hydractinia symbiolongicarpus TaxID=13093 RepID=UPI00254CF1D5|nr:nuclear pore complex protein Nup205-like isoform X1 [Hydractinia symbiolongicarpus]